MYRIDTFKKLSDDLSLFDNLGIKLVRGAYHNSDKESSLLFKNKNETDESYKNGLNIIFNSLNNKKNLSAFICTHNNESINQMINNYDKNSDYHRKSINHASLFGFINNETKRIIDSNIKTYKYLPYGNFNDSIPYLIRRVEENPKILKYLF